MTALCLLPATLSFLLLAAHFFRGGQGILLVLALACVGLLAVRRRWAGRILQLLLLLGAAEWCRTLGVIALQRRAEGLPWLRMALILGGVALFAALAALLLQARPAARWFRRDGVGSG